MRIIGARGPFPESQNPDLFSHIPRFSYRRGFPPISTSGPTSDSGWGCCYRTGQTLLAQFILRFQQEFPLDFAAKFGETEPLALFNDISSAPFGLPRLVLETSKIGVPIGEWAKPSSLAAAAQVICQDLSIGCVVSQGFWLSKSQMDSQYPALFLIPGLFGLDRLDVNYVPFLQLCICEENCLGFVSGKRSSSYYIAGFDSKHFVYFDPHTSQKAVVGAEGFQSYYGLPPGTINFADINPSVLLGFLVRSKDELGELMDQLTACDSSPVAVIDDVDVAVCDKVLDLCDVLETDE
jgi:cysteine protease ATG4